ncbi:MAG TPA: PD-(D/E)XK nuclease family protein, partial [Gemmatimonadaceae bacterium]|nr:PD-(D/E)XK nuclease family protein [Gemmatimonadaceae bacterium]
GNAYFARRRTVRSAPDDALANGLGDAAIREDNQAWEVVEDTLDVTMPALLRVDPALAAKRGAALADGWLTLFRRALDAASPGMERPVADAVRVSGTAAGDGQPARVTIVLGLLEKRFPRQHRQDPFLRDDVRRHLRDALGLDLQTTEDAPDGERECFARAVATASDALYLSYAATDEAGKAAVTSFFVEDLQRAVGREHELGRERLGVGDVTSRVEQAGSRAELLAAVSHDIWQRLPKTVAAEAQRAAAFAAWNALAGRGATGGLVPIARGRAAAARPVFDPALFVTAPHATLELSASQLKSLGHCTYKHFVEKVLAPESLDEPAYDALRKGTLVHDAMMQWVALDGWNVGDAALAELDAWMEARIAAYPPAVREPALARYQLEADRARVIEFIRGELALIASVNGFRPRYNELAFGNRSLDRGPRDPASVPRTFELAVATSLGERLVRFTGSVDRLDVMESDGQTLGVAIDYKTGKTSKHYADAMLAGSDLQLRLYLLALEQIWGITPVGALYVGFGDGVRRGVMRADAAERMGGVGDAKCVRLLSAEEWHAFVYEETPRLIEPLIDRLVRLDIVARPRDGDCGFCELGPLCRYDRHAPQVISV